MLRFAMHFASGNSLVSGLAMLLVAYVLLATRNAPGRWTVFAIRMLMFLGTAFVILATIPHSAVGWLALGLTAAPLYIKSLKTSASARRDWPVPLCAFLFTLVGIAVLWVEYGQASVKIPPSAMHRPIIVIGDSLSAAETDPKITAWPEQIATKGFVVINQARMGATAASALKQASLHRPPDSIVLVMIGGNDLLGPTTPRQFEVSLEELIKAISSDASDVVLFELPLPPFKFEWGAIQRRIAEKYRCRLVTRRLIARVLGGPGNTVDGIHLSRQGHEEMARLILDRVLPAE